MINMQSTFDLSSFKSINAPSLGAYSISSFLFPKGEKLFGETFYAIFDGKIYGLKILAWALGGSSEYPSRIYLIQAPTFTKWTNLADTPLFTSVNDLVEGKNKFDIPLIWDYSLFENAPTNLRLTNFESYSGKRNWGIRQSFYYSKGDGLIGNTKTKIAYLVGTPQGIFFGLEQKKDCYNTREECLSATFNGMDIVDFAEPTIIEIKLEIPSTEVVTRKLVLE